MRATTKEQIDYWWRFATGAFALLCAAVLLGALVFAACRWLLAPARCEPPPVCAARVQVLRSDYGFDCPGGSIETEPLAGSPLVLARCVCPVGP